MKAPAPLRAVMFFFTFVIALAVGGGIASAAPYGHTSPRLGVAEPSSCTASHITTSGQGFSPNSAVKVYRDGSFVAMVNAGASGQFSAQIDVTAAAPGDHSVSATDATTGVSASSAFSVQSGSCTGNDATNVVATTDTSSLAFTGTEVTALGGIAVVALAAGVSLVVLGRRRA